MSKLTDDDIAELERSYNGLIAVFKFQEASGHNAVAPYAETHVNEPNRELRRVMLADPDQGEVTEFLNADLNNDLVEALDGLGDSIVVAYGGMLQYLQGNWYIANLILAEIGRSNLSKVVEGQLIKRDDGKVMKPDTYSPPRIREILEYFDIEIPPTLTEQSEGFK